MWSAKRVVLLGALIVLTPPLAVSGMLVLAVLCDPMGEVFQASFRVENRTNQPLWITPVGTFNSGGKDVLPQYGSSYLPGTIRSINLRIEPGGSTSITYDCDDINFSEIVVRNAAGEYRQVVVDPDPPKKNYYANDQKLFTIGDWETLPPAAANVVAVAQIPDGWWRNWGPVLATFAVTGGLYVWLLNVYRNCREDCLKRHHKRMKRLVNGS